MIINADTYKGLDKALKHAEELGMTTPLSSENGQGETVVIQRYQDCIQLQTFQHNDWVRVNEFYSDGTITETYER